MSHISDHMKNPKKMIRTPVIMGCLFLASLTVLAKNHDLLKNDSLPQPAPVVSRGDSSSRDLKICSCQLLKVYTDKYDPQLTALFAEKTPDSKRKNEYRLLGEYINREKIYLKIVFARTVEMLDNIERNTSCLSLYDELKKQYGQLKLYNIIDVDILLALASR